MTGLDRLRAMPRQWIAMGATGFGCLVIVFIVFAAGRSDGSISSTVVTGPADPTADETATTSGAPPTATTSVPAPQAGTAATSTTTARIPTFTINVDSEYRLAIDADTPAVEGRSVPDEPDADEPPPVTIAPPPWAASTRLTKGGQIATDVGCADNRGSAALDWFLSSRVGPVLGWDYQHVYPLGDDRYLWLFQDAFLDHSGTKTTLDSARFIHNAAMVQDGECFTLMHRGTADKPLPFEVGDGTVDVRKKWLWPMGGELVDGELFVFWAEMLKDPYDPDPPDGLGWHPNRLFLASYDAETLERTDYISPPDNGVTPIYGYAVSSDETHTYLFGNTFEQNLFREGGFWNGPHSATAMYLARVPLGKITAKPEYRTADGWSPRRQDAVAIIQRFYAENPMQPRYLDGQWVSATAVDGYWGDHLAIDVADQPWGPWSTVRYSPLLPRNNDPKMNTYHAQPLPWRDAFGSVQITVSNNARNMQRDAWPRPHRYRPTVIFTPYAPTPTTTTTTTVATTTTVRPATTTTTLRPTTTSSTTSSTSTTSTTQPTSTTTQPTSTTTSSTTSSTTTTLPTTTTSTTVRPTTTSTTSTTTSTTTP